MQAIIVTLIICATVLILGIVGEVGKCIRNKQDNESMQYVDDITSRRERK